MGWQSKFFAHREVPCTCKVLIFIFFILRQFPGICWVFSSPLSCPVSYVSATPQRWQPPRAVLGPALASSGEPQAGRSE